LPPHAPGPGERALVTQTARHNFGPPGEIKSAAKLNLSLCGGEEWRPETQRNRSTDDGQREVEEVDHRCHGATNQSSGSFDYVRRCQGRRLARDRGQCRTGCLGLETASTTADTGTAIGDNDHVSNVPGVPETSLE
jgi:hypothetical protein